MKLKTIILTLMIMCFATGVFGQEIFVQETFTRTLYNNDVPYKAFFVNQQTTKIKVQKGNTQAVIPVVNDEKKDLTKVEVKEVKKGQ